MNNYWRLPTILLVVATLLLLLSGCGIPLQQGLVSVATNTPTKTPTWTPTSTPTNTPLPTATQEVPPSATPEVAPSTTPVVADTATPVVPASETPVTPPSNTPVPPTVMATNVQLQPAAMSTNPTVGTLPQWGNKTEIHLENGQEIDVPAGGYCSGDVNVDGQKRHDDDGSTALIEYMANAGRVSAPYGADCFRAGGLNAAKKLAADRKADLNIWPTDPPQGQSVNPPPASATPVPTTAVPQLPPTATSVPPPKPAQPSDIDNRCHDSDHPMVPGEVRDLQNGCAVKGDIEVLIPNGSWHPYYDSNGYTGLILRNVTGKTIKVRAPWGANMTNRTDCSLLEEMLQTGCSPQGCTDGVFVLWLHALPTK